MDKRFAIFDMDGTLVDSMAYWKDLGREYLALKGVTGPLNDVLERIKPMTVPEAAQLFLDTFGLPGTAEQIAGEINARMAWHYREDIPLKPGANRYLEQLRREGVRLCVASATSEELMEACLRRLGVLGYFEFLLSCEEIGSGKDLPDVYHAAAKRLGAPPGEIAVFEDALYAVRTAKNAGYYVIGVYEEHSPAQWPKITRLADETVAGWDRAIQERGEQG